jgi:hypothetical protein
MTPRRIFPTAEQRPADEVAATRCEEIGNPGRQRRFVMVGIILFLVIAVGLGLRLARWVALLSEQPDEAVRPAGEPRNQRPFSWVGTGL